MSKALGAALPVVALTSCATQAQVEGVEALLLALRTQEQQTLFSLAVLLGEPPEGFDVNAHNLTASSHQQLQYRQGTADLLTVLQAQQTLFSAQDELAQTTFANRQAAVRLYASLGGGWMESREDRTQFTR